MAVDFSKSHKAMDVAEHERTYAGFMKVTVFCTAATLAVLALMAIFLL